MALPPGFLDELRGRLSLSQVAGRKVMWDARKSNPGKGDMWAPCPFHHEKTASFHVDDRKGYYYCFGCHAKGDAISFVRETENVSFIEAVEILAGEAGMPMPERDPRAQEKADRRTLLAEVMEDAVKFFQMQLKRGVGADAKAYLNAKRGLDDAAIDRWEVGFAPDAWQALWDHLRGKSVEEELILAAGLAKPSQKGGKPYDTFRNRIMFPIRDARGRCIAFGGRAMDPNDNAKYLNSPETELFDKGRSLYNHAPAREAAGKGHDLIVAEGYMDVIALSEAGFKGAVAPLGTAITEDQLALLWRMSSEPIIMLDGDTAGQRAANRLIDLALPKLSDANSLFFVTLPDGTDPDDFLKAKGAPALTEVLSGEDKKPLVQMLWQRELQASPTDTPEQKAGLDKRLRAAITAIQDPDIRRYYGETIKDYRWQAFRPVRSAGSFQPGGGRKRQAPGGPLSGTKSSMLADAEKPGNILNVEHTQFHRSRERMIAAFSVFNPQVALSFREGLESFEARDACARNVIAAVIAWDAAPTREEAIARVKETCLDDLENILGDPYVRLHPIVRQAYDDDVVLHEFAENIARVTADRAALLEREEAEEEIDVVSSEALTWRLGQSAAALNEAFRGDQEDRTEYVTGDNGHGVSRDEQDRFQSLLDKISYSKRQH